MKSVIIAICIFLMIVILAVAGLCILELGASNTLLRKMALLQPGMNLNEVKKELGQQLAEMHEIDEMIICGSIKNRAFCQQKKIFWYYASAPPCRIIEVYTDQNNVVAYVTWRGSHRVSSR
jgi:hypothetical protein